MDGSLIGANGASRSDGLRRMAAFQPRMGRSYAAGRNHDEGPGRRRSVSELSPWISRRLILEEEVIAAALGAHGAQGADKFVQEVLWRGYFKGWLEHRPGVWRDYRQAVARGWPALGPRLAAAEEGRTGIVPFDTWAVELRDTGYLHNHARMWFASIWIFTLGLPWQAGADFFLRHLLDGDAASNTCSWRWVAGLHTPGKHYVARAANIAKFTGGRFGAVHGLASDPAPLSGENPPPQPPPPPRAPDPRLASVRLVTAEDCRVETLPPIPIRATATVHLARLRSPGPVAEAVQVFDRAALADQAARLGGATAFDHPDPDRVADWAAAAGAAQVVMAYLPQGWTRDWATGLEAALARRGIVLAIQQRPYDAVIWPHATAGFFGLKKRIPSVLRRLGLP